MGTTVLSQNHLRMAMRDRARFVDQELTACHFKSMCNELCTSLAYHMPKRPYDHMDAYLVDPDCDIVLASGSKVESRLEQNANYPQDRARVVDKYFKKHSIREFFMLVGEKMIMEVAKGDLRAFMRKHVHWGITNLHKKNVELSFERNEWRLKPRALDEASAATKIQAGFRGKAGRKRHNKIRRTQQTDYADPECEDAAITKQAEDAGYSLEQDAAARQIQGAARRRTANSKVDKARKSREQEQMLRQLAKEQEMEGAAIKIQGISRKKYAKRKVAKKRKEKQLTSREWTKDEEEAAQKIQTAARRRRDTKRVKRVKSSKQKQAELEHKQWQDDEVTAAIKLQTSSRRRNAKKRVKRLGDAKKRQGEMEAKEWNEEEHKAATALQSNKRRRNASKRVKRIKDSKQREAQMSSKEWNEQEVAAATSIQAGRRAKKSRQRVQNIKDGSESAFPAAAEEATTEEPAAAEEAAAEE